MGVVPITTQDIYDRFRAIYAEKSQRFFDTTLWAPQAISDSIDDIAQEIEPLNPDYVSVVLAQIGYVANQREYNLPVNFERVVKVEVTDTGGPPFPVLGPIDFEDIGSMAIGPSAPWLSGGGLGEPQAYYIRGAAVASSPNLLGLDPIPNRTAVNNLNLYYTGTRATVTTIDTSTTPDLPVDLHPLIPLRMAVLAAIVDNNPNLGAYTALYNARLTNILGEALRGREVAGEPFDIVGFDF